MELKRVVGQCATFFFMAATFDLVGLILLLVGVSPAPQIGGRWYGDFLAITGSLLMFFGLGLWVMWYAGNIAADGKRSSFRRLTRKLTQRLSSFRDGGENRKAEEETEEEEDGGKSDKLVAYTNEAFEPEDKETV